MNALDQVLSYPAMKELDLLMRDLPAGVASIEVPLEFYSQLQDETRRRSAWWMWWLDERPGTHLVYFRVPGGDSIKVVPRG